jgi:hypothetical protein
MQMDTLRTNGALVDDRNVECPAPKFAREQPAESIRLLEDWELAMAGGGDFGPFWP